ncbi:CLUMA_CG002602, isoform A [Clunio marinus]|uniref:CLUMA_CG002602, isoform A n=1 Tax=Clunio marinus TaxID=568069 RepID=A0A1J1HML9_9DIPT|nr:CLUMA_CG002602, isoform A [Clunio marinus]
MENVFEKNRAILTAIIYGTLLLDNILLTVIVPILPDFLQSFNNKTQSKLNIPSSVLYKSFDLHYIPNSMLNKHPVAGNTLRNVSKDHLLQHNNGQGISTFNVEMENGNVGILLAVKAFVQLFFNPIVGNLSGRFGYKNLIFCGTINLLISSLIFCVGDSFLMLLIARAVEGIGSACINVCGMSLIAQLYPEDHHRSKVMGIVLGSIALGVLFGYPLGGILYDFVSESAPFIIIAFFLFTDLAFQITFFDFSKSEYEVNDMENRRKNGSPQWIQLLSNKLVFTITGAIWLSTSAMAILEPLLPIWLIAHLHPKKWQLGTVFIPDSAGYFIGTNFFGTVAFKIGQIKMSVIAIMVVGVSCAIIPEAKTVTSLIIPHFCLGLGIGILDTSLVPYLARIADSVITSADDCSEVSDVSASNYGNVYAIQQSAVSLAYSIVPFLGGELAESMGFRTIMRILGITNFIYGPILLYITMKHNLNSLTTKEPDLLLKETNPSNYRRFYDSID